MITLSIVSHHHGKLITSLFDQISIIPEISQILLTINIPEQLIPLRSTKTVVLINPTPQGFATNHNAAFKHCTQPYFCVLNPDIEFQDNPFPQLITTLQQHQAAVVAPKIINPEGTQEDSIRDFPTLNSLFAKLLHGHEGRHQAPTGHGIVFPDWIAGMFMLFDSQAFARIGGFDARYFLYYEDVDICARLHQAQQTIVADLNTAVIHHAQRASRRNLQYMRWHLSSMVRYLWQHRRWLATRHHAIPPPHS